MLTRIVMLVSAVFLLTAPVFAQNKAQPSVYARTLFTKINAYRQQQGLPSLRYDSRLYGLARSHSFTMFRQKRLSHLHFNERFQAGGGRFCVENVGWHYTNPLQQLTGWQGSSGHDGNILNGKITRGAVARVGDYVTFFACQ